MYKREFHFSRKLDQLSVFHVSMRKLKVDVGVFDYTYNGIESSVIFNTKTSPWRLVFMKNGVGDVLTIDINNGYKFTIDSYDKYNKFRAYFEIGGTAGTFKITDFFNKLNDDIPSEYVLTRRNRQVIYEAGNYSKRGEDGIYPAYFMNWPEIHAKNPKLDPKKHHATKINHDKTKQLFPELYEEIKGLDISVVYKNAQTEKTKKFQDKYKITGLD